MKYIKSTRVWSILKALYLLARNQKKHPVQKIKNNADTDFVYLGSAYGGWTFDGSVKELHNSTIISAGLGQDASFDVEFASLYNAKVIVVDPTPDSIKYYEELLTYIGCDKTVSYVDGGLQPFQSYGFGKLKSTNFSLIKKALWNKAEELKFFLPKNTDHISHSIVNYQNQYSQETAFIKVKALSLVDLLREEGLEFDDVPLVKLDIEGAEIEVIVQFLSDGFYPKQILVEFDELNKPSKRAYERVSYVHEKLIESGYECAHTDGQADFLYLRKG